MVVKLFTWDMHVPSALQIILYAAEALVIWAVSTVVYRRFMHPLAKVPGPFLPAVSRLYLWYWNVIQDGQYYRKIDEMHEKYGPVVRIGPNEIHLSDPDNYDKIHNLSGKFDKDPTFYNALGVDVMFTAITHETHRMRSAPLAHFFSRRVVLELEDIVQEKANKLFLRVQASLEAGEPANLRSGFRAVSIDVLTAYAFDDCWNHLDEPDFANWFSEAVRGTGVTWWTFQQFPFLMGPVLGMPEAWARKTSPALNDWLDCVVRTREFVTKVHRNFEAGVKPTRRSIFHELLDAPATKGYHPTIESMSGEALSFCTAAADTTGNAMEMAAYHVVNNPAIYKKLVAELRAAFPDPKEQLDFLALEKLPYLTGVIKEGMRLSYGVLSRLARAAPKEGATFNGYFVPGGTTVSMSSWIMHHDPVAFPSPEVFDPDRWTDPVTYAARDRRLVSFSRGSRTCIGQNLAYCELYVTLGTIFRHFDSLVAYDVGPEDMTYVDYFTAFHPKDSRPFRVVTTGWKTNEK